MPIHNPIWSDDIGDQHLGDRIRRRLVAVRNDLLVEKTRELDVFEGFVVRETLLSGVFLEHRLRLVAGLML